MIKSVLGGCWPVICSLWPDLWVPMVVGGNDGVYSRANTHPPEYGHLRQAGNRTLGPQSHPNVTPHAPTHTHSDIYRHSLKYTSNTPNMTPSAMHGKPTMVSAMHERPPTETHPVNRSRQKMARSFMLTHAPLTLRVGPGEF